jgi:hypothetical protein
MTQETTKQEAAKDAAQGVATEPAKELDAQQAEGVGGGALINVSLDMGSCDASAIGNTLIGAYEGAVEATSYVIERVANATKPS